MNTQDKWNKENTIARQRKYIALNNANILEIKRINDLQKERPLTLEEIELRSYNIEEASSNALCIHIGKDILKDAFNVVLEDKVLVSWD